MTGIVQPAGMTFISIPMKHGPVTEVVGWPFSSFHKSIAMGSIRRPGQARTMRRMIGASAVERSGANRS
jgi:hypothetical protein